MTTASPDPYHGFDTPGNSLGLLELFRYRYLLTLLIRKGIATRYHGSVLGWAWSYVKPGAQFLLYYLALGVFLGLNQDIRGFPLYLFSGIVAVNLFSEAFKNATLSIVDNEQLVKKIYLPRELFPLAAVGVALIHFLPQAIILLLASVIFGWTFTLQGLLAFIVGVLILTILATGLGMIFGAVNVAFRDAQNFADLILMFVTWTSPVLYSWTMVASKLPDWAFELYMANPITSAVELFHLAFWAPVTNHTAPIPDLLWQNSLIGLAVSILVLIIGQLIFRKLEGTFAQKL